MRTQKSLTYTAISFKIACTLIVLIFLTGIIQIISTQIYWEFSGMRNRINQSVVKRTGQEKQQREIDKAHKEFTPDGTVYLVNNEGTFPGTNEKKLVIKDQQNNVLFTGKEKDNPYSFIQWYPKQKNRFDIRNIDQRRLKRLSQIGGEFSHHFVIPMVDSDNKRIGHWYFDMEKRIFKYYTISGQQLGYLGTNGYTEKKENAVGFKDCQETETWLRPNSYDPILLYQTRNAVYQIDFRNKQVQTLVDTGSDDIRKVILNNWQEIEESDYRPILSILTESDKLYLHLKNPTQTIETKMLPDFHYFDIPQFAANSNTTFVTLQETPGVPKTKDIDIYMAWWRKNQDKPKERRVRLFEVDKAGSFTEKSSFVWTQPARNPIVIYATSPDTFPRCIKSFSTLVPMRLTRKMLRTGSYRQGPVWLDTTMDFVKEYSTFISSANLYVMACFAILAFLHGWPRRTHIAKLIFWIVFVFLLNLPGFLTYLALNHTPLIRCANCGKKRGILQDTCCRCGISLPQPKTRETDLVMAIPT